MDKVYYKTDYKLIDWDHKMNWEGQLTAYGSMYASYPTSDWLS